MLEEEGVGDIPEQYHYMLDLLDHISAQAGQEREQDPTFTTVLYQLIYLLPLEVSLKQRLLEIPACSDRAGILHAELIRLGVIQYIQPDTDPGDPAAAFIFPRLGLNSTGVSLAGKRDHEADPQHLSFSVVLLPRQPRPNSPGSFVEDRVQTARRRNPGAERYGFTRKILGRRLRGLPVPDRVRPTMSPKSFRLLVRGVCSWISSTRKSPGTKWWIPGAKASKKTRIRRNPATPADERIEQFYGYFEESVKAGATVRFRLPGRPGGYSQSQRAKPWARFRARTSKPRCSKSGSVTSPPTRVSKKACSDSETVGHPRLRGYDLKP